MFKEIQEKNKIELLKMKTLIVGNKKKTSGMYMKNPNLTENCKRMTNINSAGTEKYRIDFFF